MSLLSTRLLIVLGVLTVIVPVGAYLLWGRVRGPGPVRTLTRLAMIVTSQLVALSLVAAAINDYGYFYKSWSEMSNGLATIAGLRSTAHQPPEQAPHLSRGSPASAGDILVRSEDSYAAPSQWNSRGRLESVTIDGGRSRLHSHAFVYLPPQYFQPRYARTYFPAIEVFTGYPGIDQYLVSRLKYQDVLRRLIDKHRARPTVLVMMRPSVTFPRDTECTDVPGGPQAQTFFGADVPAEMVDHYRVLPTGWGAIGDSTGGYCAIKLAMLNPDLFSAAAALSGYFFALRDHTTGDLWGGSATIRHLNDLHWRLAHMPPPPVSVLVGTSPSEGGPDGYGEARKFARAVRAPMTVGVMSVPDGGHNFATWSAELPTALAWLSSRLPAPGPSPAPPPASATTPGAPHGTQVDVGPGAGPGSGQGH